MSKCKIVLGTLSGLAIGAAAGILFAPKKGSKTRKQIMGKGDDCVNTIKSKLNEFSDSITAKFENTIQDAEEIVDKGIEKFDEVKNDVKNTTANIKHDVSADIKHDGRKY